MGSPVSLLGHTKHVPYVFTAGLPALMVDTIAPGTRGAGVEEARGEDGVKVVESLEGAGGTGGGCFQARPCVMRPSEREQEWGGEREGSQE